MHYFLQRKMGETGESGNSSKLESFTLQCKQPSIIVSLALSDGS